MTEMDRASGPDAAHGETLFEHPARSPSLMIGASVLIRVDAADPLTSGRVDGHVHVSVFAGRDSDHRAKCGDLAFRVSEFWPIWRVLRHDFDFSGLDRVPPPKDGWLHTVVHSGRYYSQLGRGAFPELAERTDTAAPSLAIADPTPQGRP